MITAGATPIEINCKIFDSGSKKSVKVGSIIKLKMVIISPTNIAYKPIPAIAM
jgi:hypothetical protein